MNNRENEPTRSIEEILPYVNSLSAEFIQYNPIVKDAQKIIDRQKRRLLSERLNHAAIRIGDIVLMSMSYPYRPFIYPNMPPIFPKDDQGYDC